MITPKDVPLWSVSRGIGCVVLTAEHPGPVVRTPHSLIFGAHTQKKTPSRICRKCREAMKEITRP